MIEFIFGLLTVFSIGMIVWMCYLNRKKKTKFVVKTDEE